MKTKLFKLSTHTNVRDRRCKADCGTCPYWVAETCRIDDELPEPPKVEKPLPLKARNFGWVEEEDMTSNMPISPSHPDGGLPLLGGLDRLISQSNRHFAQFNEEGGVSNGASRIRKLIAQLDELFVPGWRPVLPLRTRLLTDSEIREELEYYNLLLEEMELEEAKEDAMLHVAETLNESFYDPMNEEEELIEMVEEDEEEESRFYNSDSPWAVTFEIAPRTVLEVWTPYPEWTIMTPSVITRSFFGKEIVLKMTPLPIPEELMTTEQLKEHSKRQQRKITEVLLPEGYNPVDALHVYLDKLREKMAKEGKRVSKWYEDMLQQALRDVYMDPRFGTGALRTIWVERSGQIPRNGTHQRFGNRRMPLRSYYSKMTTLIKLGYFTKDNKQIPITFNHMKAWVTWAINHERITKYEAKCLWNLWKGEVKLAKLYRQKESQEVAHGLPEGDDPNEVRA
jgi:hypothetical protein